MFKFMIIRQENRGEEFLKSGQRDGNNLQKFLQS